MTLLRKNMVLIDGVAYAPDAAIAEASRRVVAAAALVA